MAQFIHRNKAWLVRIPISRDRATGKRRFHHRTVHGTKRDAQRYATAFQRRLDLGEFVEPTRQIVGDYLDTWLASAAGRVRERTKHEYERLLARYVRPKIGSIGGECLKRRSVGGRRNDAGS